jgi:hypothetical protein
MACYPIHECSSAGQMMAVDAGKYLFRVESAGPLHSAHALQITGAPEIERHDAGMPSFLHRFKTVAEVPGSCRSVAIPVVLSEGWVRLWNLERKGTPEFIAYLETQE